MPRRPWMGGAARSTIHRVMPLTQKISQPIKSARPLQRRNMRAGQSQRDSATNRTANARCKVSPLRNIVIRMRIISLSAIAAGLVQYSGCSEAPAGRAVHEVEGSEFRKPV